MKRLIFGMVFSFCVLIFSYGYKVPATYADAILNSFSFVEEFFGRPEAPTPWSPYNWDIVVHSRDIDTWQELDPIVADHGSDCSGAPHTHVVTKYEDAVFSCNNHVMTALSADTYGVIYLTPDRVVDFSKGEAVIKWEMSTLRRSSRDWIDVWITPFDQHLELPLNMELPDLAGPPQNAINISLDYSWNSVFKGRVVRNFEEIPIEGTADYWKGYEMVLTPDAIRRDKFELHISETHIKFGMPDYDLWWIDTDIESLGWTGGIVQFGHHSYNPKKACDFDGSCDGNTWHWDNISITPSRQISLIRGKTRYVDGTTDPTMVFPQGAPQNGYLRFAGIGFDLEVSLDDGKSWQPAQMQLQRSDKIVDDHFKSYWMPIPMGTTRVQFRGKEWWGGDWQIRDVSIWANDAMQPTAVEYQTYGDTDTDHHQHLHLSDILILGFFVLLAATIIVVIIVTRHLERRASQGIITALCGESKRA